FRLIETELIVAPVTAKFALLGDEQGFADALFAGGVARRAEEIALGSTTLRDVALAIAERRGGARLATGERWRKELGHRTRRDRCWQRAAGATAQQNQKQEDDMMPHALLSLSLDLGGSSLGSP
ncbi:MAG: hypothetical protein OET79_15345, partial [Nitrospirota bacterium]|nr:hypothetical protein [Nitrospirota bacterium]